MHDGTLVRVNKYSKKIKELTIVKRISVEYPLLCQDIVAKMLSKVAETLPNHLQLQVDSAYRTRKTQEILWSVRKGIIGDLVYNPQNGTPPHCTGGAVDAALLDKGGRELNLSEPFQKYYNEPQLISNKITTRAQELRLLLNKTMLDAGFAPHPREYWHFSYGDRMWAEYYRKDLIYHELDIPEAMYHRHYKILWFKLLRHVWKFMNKYLRIHTNY